MTKANNSKKYENLTDSWQRKKPTKGKERKNNYQEVSVIFFPNLLGHCFFFPLLYVVFFLSTNDQMSIFPCVVCFSFSVLWWNKTEKRSFLEIMMYTLLKAYKTFCTYHRIFIYIQCRHRISTILGGVLVV